MAVQHNFPARPNFYFFPVIIFKLHLKLIIIRPSHCIYIDYKKLDSSGLKAIQVINYLPDSAFTRVKMLSL